MIVLRLLFFATFAATAIATCCGSRLAMADDAEFRDHVAPILESACLRCHQGLAARGGLRLETREDLIVGGDSGPAITPGDVEGSLLMDMIVGDEPMMPEEGDPLAADQIATLEHWIGSGAAWPADRKLHSKDDATGTWWSLKPLSEPTPPALSNSWVRNPLDAFVLAGLDEAGLEPSPTADRRTLIRRLFYDLIGMPPAPDDVEHFLADTDPLAYERLVDRLLASPQFGERWARHWLDVVHYGETHGYDKDKRRDHAWPYRDYVIRAFNSDKPYARFLREQLAGDALFADDPDGIVATGFVVAGPWDFVGHVELREGTVEKKKTRLLDRDDMVTTTMSTFASTTAHCARCHDHPFDPIAQQEYYQLQSVFAGVKRSDRSYHSPRELRRRATYQEQLAELTKQRESFEEQISAATTSEMRKLSNQLSEVDQRLDALPDPFSPPEEMLDSPTNGYHSAIESEQDVTKHVTIDLGQVGPIDVVRLIPARPVDFRDTPGFGFPLRFRVECASAADFHDAFLIADESERDFPNPGNRSVSFPGDGQPARYVRVTAIKLWQRTNDFIFALAEVQVDRNRENIAASAGVSALDTIDGGRWHRQNLVDGFSSRHRLPDISDRPVVDAIEVASALEETRRDLLSRYESLAAATIPEQLISQRDEANRRYSEITLALENLPVAEVYAAVSIEPRPVNLLHRGNINSPGDAARPAGLAAVTSVPSEFALSDDASDGSRRAALADWLANPDHPLVWRSIANRVWQYHFNRALVNTPSDFGRNGSRPSHPELLDYLAGYLLDHDGSLKSLHRLIVNSATYRQSSVDRENASAVDSDNRLLWRMNRRRLESEAVRDSVLAVSGALDTELGGPSFEPFGFEDDHSPRYDYTAESAHHSARRSVYRYLVRSVPDPFMETLDCPDPSISAPVRSTTITALQALTLSNHPFILRQSEIFAERLAEECRTDEERLELAFVLALSRPPITSERDALLPFAQLHGWVNTCRLIFNLNEFVYID